MTRDRKQGVSRAALIVSVGAVIGIAAARADSPPFTATNPVWHEECGRCHIPYPPALLPAESWRALMAHLDRHFGVDVKISAKKAKTIREFLDIHAGRAQAGGQAAPLRITETSWFAYKHDAVPGGAWTVAAVKNAKHCPVCHTRAAHGDFSKRTLKIPKKP